MADIKVTDKVNYFFDWLEDKGVVSWDSPDGIIVDSDVQAAIEGVIAMGAGASVTITRDQNSRVTNLAFSGFDGTDYDTGVTKMEGAIDSYGIKGIGDGEGYSP